jgi:hypothetical protein
VKEIITKQMDTLYSRIFFPSKPSRSSGEKKRQHSCWSESRFAHVHVFLRCCRACHLLTIAASTTFFSKLPFSSLTSLFGCVSFRGHLSDCLSWFSQYMQLLSAPRDGLFSHANRYNSENVVYRFYFYSVNQHSRA